MYTLSDAVQLEERDAVNNSEQHCQTATVTIVPHGFEIDREDDSSAQRLQLQNPFIVSKVSTNTGWCRHDTTKATYTNWVQNERTDIQRRRYVDCQDRQTNVDIIHCGRDEGCSDTTPDIFAAGGRGKVIRGK